MCAHVLSHVYVTPWTIACQAPLSMGILQAYILEWVAISFSRGSSQPRDPTRLSCVSCIGRRVLYHCATWEAHFMDGQAYRPESISESLFMYLCSLHLGAGPRPQFRA